MAVDDVLQLRWVDVIPGGNNHPLDSLPEVNKAILIHPAQIAGMEPDPALIVTAQGLRRLLRIVHIAQHHCRPGDANLTVCVGRQLLGRTGLHDLIVCIRERNANRARPGIVLGRQTGSRDALRGAVTLPDLFGAVVLLQKQVHLFLQFRR